MRRFVVGGAVIGVALGTTVALLGRTEQATPDKPLLRPPVVSVTSVATEAKSLPATAPEHDPLAVWIGTRDFKVRAAFKQGCWGNSCGQLERAEGIPPLRAVLYKRLRIKLDFNPTRAVVQRRFKRGGASAVWTSRLEPQRRTSWQARRPSGLYTLKAWGRRGNVVVKFRISFWCGRVGGGPVHDDCSVNAPPQTEAA
jgi:hypothetical protein